MCGQKIKYLWEVLLQTVVYEKVVYLKTDLIRIVNKQIKSIILVLYNSLKTSKIKSREEKWCTF